MRRWFVNSQRWLPRSPPIISVRTGSGKRFAERSSNMTEHSRAPAPREWNATAYHAVSEPQFAWGLRVLDRVPLAGDERVLDAGCGSGRLTKELAARAPMGIVVACDLSANMARTAAETLDDSPACCVVRADLSRVPFRGAF